MLYPLFFLLSLASISSQETFAPNIGNGLLEPAQPVYRRFKTNLPRQHDRGGLFRLEIGAATVTPTDFESGGFTLSGQLAVGWLPWSQVGLHGTVFGWGTDEKGALGIGPGLSYWLSETSPHYISASAGPVIVISSNNELENTQIQLGGELVFGLYGWVGSAWSIGASLAVGGEAFDLDGDGNQSPRARIGIRLGVTFN